MDGFRMGMLVHQITFHLSTSEDNVGHQVDRAYRVWLIGSKLQPTVDGSRVAHLLHHLQCTLGARQSETSRVKRMSQVVQCKPFFKTTLKINHSSVQFILLTISWGYEGRFSGDPLPVFSAGGPCQQFWPGQGCPLFDVVHPAFPLPTTALPTCQGTLKDGCGEAVMACVMPEPCKFPSLGSCTGSW